MQAHRSYYGFPICPGFWDSLLKSHAAGRLLSIDRVKSEIAPGDALAGWVDTSAPGSFFATTAEPQIIANFARLMGWVQANAQFTDAAKEQFARSADGWLVAYAQTHPDHVVVTMEALARGARARVPLPNICDEFGIQRFNTFQMLEALGTKMVLNP